MDANEYQQLALRTVGPASHEGRIYTALGLGGEIGEYIEMVKHAEYHSWAVSLDQVREELGDIAWYLAIACRAWGLDLNFVLEANITKLKLRYPERYSDEESKTGRGGHREFEQ